MAPVSPGVSALVWEYRWVLASASAWQWAWVLVWEYRWVLASVSALQWAWVPASAPV